jgi:chemotaxis protein MotA
MDPATIIGVGLALVVVVVSNVLEGGDPMSLLLFPPMLLVFGSTLLVAFAGGTVADFKLAVRGLVQAFTGRAQTAGDLVPSIVTLAEKARREGLLSLEDSLSDVDDPFLVRALTLAIDGTDPHELRDMLESEVQAQKVEHRQAAKFFAAAGGYAPTIGIIGTVMGLVHVLENLARPEELGHLIAGAFVATLWGVLSANLVFLPIAALQSGSNPRMIGQKLRSLLPADERDAEAA